MTKLLVTGVGGPAGRNVAKLLLERGHAVAGTDMRDVDMPGISFYRVPAANDPAFLDELHRLAEKEQAALVIPTVTEELPIVAERWNVRGNIHAMIGSFPAVFAANDKWLTSEQLAKHGVTIPRYRLPSQVKTPDDIATALGWPCLSKPRVGRGGRGVTVHYEKDWQHIVALDDQFILQEFMPGADYAPNVCIRPLAEPVVVVLEKTKLKEGIVGNAAEVKRVDAPDVAAVAIAAARALGFVGPLDVDVRRRADGQPAVLEINARFGANIAYAPEVLDAALTAFGVC